MWRQLILFMCFIILLSGCASTNNANTSSSNTPPPTQSEDIHQEEAADQVPLHGIKPEELVHEIVHLLKDRDMLRLAAYVHPINGLRLSPYGYIDTQKDVVLTAVELQTAMDEENTRLWGHHDGSGEPIQLTFAAYYDQFIYDHDYAMTEEIGYNQSIGEGNSLNNVKEVYPNGFVVEYHYPGSEEYEGMDWSSLRIVLELYEGQWVCSALIHDQWTI